MNYDVTSKLGYWRDNRASRLNARSLAALLGCRAASVWAASALTRRSVGSDDWVGERRRLFHDFMAYDWMTRDDLGADIKSTPPP